MDHIKKDFGLTMVFPLHHIGDAYAALASGGRKCILHFLNLGGLTGDHIDLFDGTGIYNEINGNPDHGHHGFDPKTKTERRGWWTETHYFNRARRIDFIELQ